MKADRGKWVPESMPYDVESRKKFKPTVEPYDVGMLLDRVDTYEKGPKAIPIPEVDDEHDIYDVMCARLAFPNSIRLRRLLEWEFTQFEMEVCHLLQETSMDSQAEDLAKMLDVSVTKVKDTLQGLFQKGAIFPRDYKKWRGFRFLPRGLYQLHDGGMTNPALDLKYAPTVYNLWNDFVIHDEATLAGKVFKKFIEKGESPQNLARRVLPAYEAMLLSPDADQIQPWEDARAIIDTVETLALAPCSCRKRVSGGGMTCKRTKAQVCLNFDKAAIGVIYKHGREITKEEAMQVIRQANRDGLVHSMEHFQTVRPFLLCACCDCCCHHWAPRLSVGWKPEYRFKKSRWEVEIAQGTCDGCIDVKEGPKCISICQFNAIEMREMDHYKESPMPEPWLIQNVKAFVDTELCWGCLSCVLVCPSHAITARCVRDESWVPVQRTAPTPRRVEYKIHIERHD